MTILKGHQAGVRNELGHDTSVRKRHNGIVFAGHYHRNAFGKDGNLEMITSGPVGRPLGADPSGIRIVAMDEKALETRYFTLGEIPTQYPPVPPRRNAVDRTR